VVVGVVGWDPVGDFGDEARYCVSWGMSNRLIHGNAITYDSRPTRSHILCISLRLPFDSAHILPTSLKKVTPSSHSSGVRSTSLVKSCKWRTAEAKISLNRGLVLGPHVSMTFCVKFWSYLWVAAAAPVLGWADIVVCPASILCVNVYRWWYINMWMVMLGGCEEIAERKELIETRGEEIYNLP
jgi:hypothetical protein